MDPNKLLDLAIVLLIAGLAGARVQHVLADGELDFYINLCLDPLKTEGKLLAHGQHCLEDAQCVAEEKGELCNVAAGTCHQGRDCLRALKIWYGGLAFYGGLLLAIGVGIWYVLRHKGRLDLWKTADLAGFAIPLGLVFGRVGCWFSGCCFGAVTHEGCGVQFPRNSPAWDRHLELHLLNRSAEASLPVIPTQLIQIGSNLLLFLICYAMYRKWRKFDGSVFWTFMILYAIFRFIIEFYRDDHRGTWFNDSLSTSQIMVIPGVIVSVIMLFYLRRRQARAYTESR
jgi:phosphatidylglycerol:prolipoprotein diacylglycerol transferase